MSFTVIVGFAALAGAWASIPGTLKNTMRVVAAAIVHIDVLISILLKLRYTRDDSDFTCIMPQRPADPRVSVGSVPHAAPQLFAPSDPSFALPGARMRFEPPPNACEQRFSPGVRAPS